MFALAYEHTTLLCDSQCTRFALPMYTTTNNNNIQIQLADSRAPTAARDEDTHKC